MGNYYGFSLDFVGGKLAVSNPEDFDDRRASDNRNFEWSAPRFSKTDASGPDAPSNWTTWINIRVKPHAGGQDSGDIKICFIGPADGRVGEVSLTTIRRVGEKTLVWPLGRKTGLEVPVAMTHATGEEVAFAAPEGYGLTGVSEDGKLVYKVTEAAG